MFESNERGRCSRVLAEREQTRNEKHGKKTGDASQYGPDRGPGIQLELFDLLRLIQGDAMLHATLPHQQVVAFDVQVFPVDVKRLSVGRREAVAIPRLFLFMLKSIAHVLDGRRVPLSAGGAANEGDEEAQGQGRTGHGSHSPIGWSKVAVWKKKTDWMWRVSLPFSNVRLK